MAAVGDIVVVRGAYFLAPIVYNQSSRHLHSVTHANLES